jgi:hypothetical protein
MPRPCREKFLWQIELAGSFMNALGILKKVEKVRASRIENEGLIPTKVGHEENLKKLGADLVPPTLGPRPVDV